jgi:lipopolysaccharide export system permease protein
MLKLIDRQMIRGFFKAYLVCLISLLSLYVVVDLFTNLDDFASKNETLQRVAKHIASYYGAQVFKIFDRLCEAIVLLAAMFTVAWMQRNNEQVPLLSAGVSTRRIVLPVLVCSCVMLGLAVVNQEVMIPRLASRLVLQRDDQGGDKDLPVRQAYEPNNIHLCGQRGVRRGQVIRGLEVLIPESVAGNQVHLTAQEAHYVPEGDGKGRWELTGCVPRNQDAILGVLDVRDEGRYVLHTRTVDFETLTRDPNWFLLASTQQIYEELQRPDSTRLAPMAVLFHTRLTRPLLGMVLVLLGLAVILRDQNRNVLISSGLCLLLCGVFFAACFACKMLGDKDILNPALSAWLPVLAFGPFAVVMFDAVHT